MTRHSKHSNDRNFFSHKERVEAGFARSEKEILGSDAFLPFGHCPLSLKAPKDPVVTPEGHIYDKEAILEYILSRKLEIAAERTAFAEQERKKARAEDSARQVESMREIAEFRKADQGLLSQDARHKRPADQDHVNVSPEKKLRKGELITIDKADMSKMSFWAPTATQTAAPAELKKPVEDVPRCPMSGKKLKVKDLIPVKFEVADHDMLKAGGGKGVYCCAVSKNPITHQQAVLLKPSGQVVLESVLKDCVLKEMRCPVSGIKLSGPKDILKLVQGGTGFSAHNDVQAKVFSHIRSRAGDDRTQHGHLPRAGYVGLK